MPTLHLHTNVCFMRLVFACLFWSSISSFDFHLALYNLWIRLKTHHSNQTHNFQPVLCSAALAEICRKKLIINFSTSESREFESRPLPVTFFVTVANAKQQQNNNLVPRFKLKNLGCGKDWVSPGLGTRGHCKHNWLTSHNWITFGKTLKLTQTNTIFWIPVSS